MIVNPRFHLPIDTRSSPHLGLAYLAAVSEQRGDDVLVYDADVEDEPITTVVKRFASHVVGITANTPQVKSAWPTAQTVKSIKDIPVVLGGPHVSVLPAESAVKPQVDVVVRGEGELCYVSINPGASHKYIARCANTKSHLLNGFLCCCLSRKTVTPG